MKKNKALTILGNLDFIIASVVLTILIILTFLGVIWRYILGQPFTWLEEVQLACMVWIVFAGGGAAFRTGNHTAIEMVVDLMPKTMQKVVQVFISVVVVVVIGYLFMNTWTFIQLMLKSGRSTSMLHIPYALIYGIALPSYVDMIVSYFYSVVAGVRSEAKEAIKQNE
jgi:TRAP-type C4-dicarboxylate transport system permease small subunit